jgi:hypothetical protein
MRVREVETMSKSYPKVPPEFEPVRPRIETSKHDRPQFGLRAAMVAIAVLCALLAWLARLELDMENLAWGVLAIIVTVSITVFVIDRLRYRD